MAFTALLMAFYRQSKRRTAEFLGTLLGQPCCPALAVKMQNQVTAALRPSYEALAAELPTQEQLNLDETPTKEENGKARLWTFVAPLFTVFAVRATRETDMVLTRHHQEKSPMSQASPPRVEQCPANLKALHRQLKEIATRAKRADRPDRDRRGHPEGPMIEVRGK
jgi:hypothetical protein